jgi:hypothetical protein
MPGKLFPLLLALLGLGGGVAAGLYLRPSPQETTEDMSAETGADGPLKTEGAASPIEDGSAPDYVKLNNQFVIPVVQKGRVAALVVLSLSIEVASGQSETVYQREPKLRDALLQVMFDHANVGGFSGSFTDAANLVVLRNNLREAATMVLGTVVRDVLITDIARQDS